jgi:hypothetical protein
VVIELQAQFGNKWARISTYLPGRTDNDVKNFWSTRQKRLARILRAPLPRRRPAAARNGGIGNGNGDAPSSSSAPSRTREVGAAAAGGPPTPSTTARASEVSLLSCFQLKKRCYFRTRQR